MNRGAPADIFTEIMFGSQFNFIDDEESTRGLYDRKHELLFGMYHLGRHIYFLIPLLCDMLWQNMKQAMAGARPKWSMLSYLSVSEKPSKYASTRLMREFIVCARPNQKATGRDRGSIKDSRIEEGQTSYGNIPGIEARRER